MDRVLEPVEIAGKTNWDAAEVFTPKLCGDGFTPMPSSMTGPRSIKSFHEELKAEVLPKLKEQMANRTNRLDEAVEILDSVTLTDELVDFLKVKAYGYLSKQ